MKKRFLSVLALLLCFAMCLPLIISCKKNEAQETDTEATEVQTEDLYRDDLPEDLRFDGQEIRFASRSFDWYYDEVTLDSDEIVEIIGQSVYDREMQVEERLGVDIVNTKIDGTGAAGYTVVMDQIRIDQASGSGEFDIVVNNMYHSMSLVTEGLFYDLKDVKYVDLEKEYYSQNYNDKSEINSSIYGVTGDASLSFIRFAMVTFFNTKLAAENKIEDLYQVVLDGRWTIDYQIQLSKDIWVDANGDQKKDGGDTYGAVLNPVTAVDPYWSAFDLSIVGRNNEGKLVSNVSVDKTVDALKKINKLFWEQDGSFVVTYKGGDSEYEEQEKMFANDQALFTTLRIGSCESYSLRNMETDYGIVPVPKFDENQPQYYSYCHDLFSVFFISSGVSAERLDMVGAALECFFSESDICRYTLFEVALKVKYQSSLAPSQMLDIVIDNMKIDAGWIYSEALDDFALCTRTLVQNRSSSFSGYWRGSKAGFEKRLEALQANS